MGAWSERKVNADLAEGLARQLMTDPRTRTVDVHRLEDASVQAGRSLVEDKLIDPKVGDMAGFVVPYGGLEAFLDVACDHPHLTGPLDRLLALSVLGNMAWGKRNSADDIYGEDSRRFDKLLDSAARAFRQLALVHMKAPAQTHDERRSVSVSTNVSWG